MVAILKSWRQINNPIRQSKRINVYVMKNIPAKFHPDSIWNDGALLGLSEEGRPNKKKKYNNNISSDMRSVPDCKTVSHTVAEMHRKLPCT